MSCSSDTTISSALGDRADRLWGQAGDRLSSFFAGRNSHKNKTPIRRLFYLTNTAFRVMNTIPKIKKEVKNVQIRVINAKAPEAKKLRVCAYARVSTDSEDQENSLENQTHAYREMLSDNPAYSFVGVYSDDGISGFKENRPGFQHMIDDAMAGKIDLIFVKSVSRFARNTEVLLKTVRALKSKGIGVFFELQNINSLSGEGELLLTVYAAFAQGESDNYSDLAKMRIHREFAKGIPSKVSLRTYGYRDDGFGGLCLDEDKAKVVRQIFDFALQGVAPSKIKNWLNYHRIPAPHSAVWDDTAIYRILRNVTYKGDLHLQKYCQDSKRKYHKNVGQAESWYIQDDHPAIVTADEWQAAQDFLENRERPTAKPVSFAKKDYRGCYLLSGKLFCPYCGSALVHKWMNKKTTESWACGTAMKKSVSACRGIYVPAQIAEGWEITEPTTVVESEKDAFGDRHYTPVPKRNYERRVGCPYKK